MSFNLNHVPTTEAKCSLQPCNPVLLSYRVAPQSRRWCIYHGEAYPAPIPAEPLEPEIVPVYFDPKILAPGRLIKLGAKYDLERSRWFFPIMDARVEIPYEDRMASPRRNKDLAERAGCHIIEPVLDHQDRGHPALPQGVIEELKKYGRKPFLELFELGYCESHREVAAAVVEMQRMARLELAQKR